MAGVLSDGLRLPLLLLLLVLPLLASAALPSPPAKCSLSNGKYTCKPTALSTTEGTDSAGDVGVNVLSKKDQKRSQNAWTRYVELTPAAGGGYTGRLAINVPAAAQRSTSIAVRVNFLGPKRSQQAWNWRLVSESGASVAAGGNNNKASWRWVMRKSSAAWPGGVASGGDTVLHLEIATASDADVCDIDFVALIFAADPSYSGGTTTTTTTTTTTATTTTATTTQGGGGGGGGGAFAPGTTWQLQLQGEIDTTVPAAIYDIDLFDTPASLIASLKADGHTVVCYFSAGSYEEWRPDAGDFPSVLLGNNLDGWPGERWLDIRGVAAGGSALAAIMKARMDMARAKGCDAVDPDNVDAYTNNNGLGLTASDQLTYNKFLAKQAHSRGLKIGLKNEVAQVPQLVSDFDFAVVEQCYQYNECDEYLPFIQQGKAVLVVEYQKLARVQSRCPDAKAKMFSLIRKKLALYALPIWQCV